MKKQPLNRALARLKRPSFSEGIGLFSCLLRRLYILKFLKAFSLPEIIDITSFENK